jgi:hypothetical protein
VDALHQSAQTSLDVPMRAHERGIAPSPENARQSGSYNDAIPHKATSYLGPRSPRSERFRNDTAVNPRNTCATRAPESPDLMCPRRVPSPNWDLRVIGPKRTESLALQGILVCSPDGI